MGKVPVNIAEFSYVMDLQFGSMFENIEWANTVKNEAEGWLTSRKQVFKGNAYVEQLEKNGVYFTESTGNIKQIVARFLHTGHPALPRHEYHKFLDKHGRNEVFPVVENMLEYIRGYSATKPKQFSTHDWAKVRHIRETKAQKAYIQELETICRWRQASTIIVDSYFAASQEEKWGGLASQIKFSECFAVVNERIDFWSYYAIGAIKLNGQQNKKQWWQFWK
jgi:hypothetical protein